MTPHRSRAAGLAVVTLALLVAVVAVLGTWQVLTARSSQQQEILDGEQNAAHLAAAALASALDSRLELVSNLAGQRQLAPLFTSDPPAKLAQLAATLHLLYPEFASFAVVRGDGVLLARWPKDPAAVGTSVSSRSYFETVVRTKSPSISGGLQQSAPPRELVVALAAPVKAASGAVAGVLVATLPTSALRSIIGSTSAGSHQQVNFFDQAGHLLTGSSANVTRSYAAATFVAGALAGGTGSGTGAVPGLAGARLVAYSSVPSTGWGVLVEEPISTLDGPIGALTVRLVILGIAVLVGAVGIALLVAQLLRRLAREQSHSGAVLESVGEGVATLDMDGRVVQLNPALERLSGRAAAHARDRSCSEVLPLFDQQGRPRSWSEAALAEAQQQRRPVASVGYGLHLGTADGRRVPIGLTAAPLLVGGDVRGTVVVVRDVSREREVDQLKSSLVSTVSHELRTPLTMIQGFSELLLTRDDLGQARARESLSQIHDSAQRLARLIDDLLSVSRIESGKMAVDLAPVDVAELAAAAVSSIARDDGARVAIEVDHALPPVLADRDKTVQILVNLITNALKYSPAGSPVRVTGRGAGDHVEISVIDRGIGIRESEREKVFEKFGRADSPEVRKVGGTGLGLYITRTLVELQQGQLWLTSEPDVGSTFTFSMAVAAAGEDMGQTAAGRRA